MTANGEAPLISVVIPVLNGARTIRRALESVLAQKPFRGTLEVTVVDNRSDDGTLDVARSFGADRVRIHLQPARVSMCENWNTCIAVARGKLVHILHADDYVDEGFYAAVAAAFERRPDADLCLVRSFIVDEKEEILRIAQRYTHTDGVLDPSMLFYGNEFLCPGLVVPRAVYARLGGFRQDLLFTTDWEMWLRIIAQGTGVYVNFPHAYYRETHVTGALARSAQCSEELLSFGKILQTRFAAFEPERFRRFVYDDALFRARALQRLGDNEGYRANMAVCRRLMTGGEALRLLLAWGRDRYRALTGHPANP